MHPRGHGAVVTGMIAAMLLAFFTVLSAGAITPGFVSYYTAARLLVSGELGPLSYDDRWFGDAVQRVTSSSVRDSFVPNPPTMALMALPLAAVGARPARSLWLIGSLALFIAGVAALVRYQAAKNHDIPIPVLMLMMLAPAVFTNLRLGQGHLIVFALFAGTALMLLRGRDRLAGVGLGLLLAFKTAGVALALLLIVRQRWTALAAAAVTAVLLASVITPFIDAGIWWAYLSQVRAELPAGRTMLAAAATGVTLYFARQSARSEPWIAAGATLAVVSMPAEGESHFVLMAIPLALLRLASLEILIIGALLIVPLEYSVERFTTGWPALSASPRLLAAWLMWAAALREVRQDGGLRN